MTRLLLAHQPHRVEREVDTLCEPVEPDERHASLGRSALGLAGLIALAATGLRSPLPYLALTAGAGVASPPVGPAMRAVWVAATDGPDELHQAYGLDAATEGVAFMSGPLLVGAVVAGPGPVTALALTAGCLLAGASLLVGGLDRRSAVPGRTVTDPTDPGRADPEPRRPPAELVPIERDPARPVGALRHRGFVALLAVVVVASAGTSAVDVTVTARAVGHHQAAAAGYVLAALALGSAAGGLGWGRLHNRRRTSTQVIGLVAATAVGIALAAVTPDLVLLGLVLAATGLVLTPALVINYITAGELAGAAGTEATAWVNTAGNGGLALGAGLAGLAVDQAGPTLPMLVGAALLGATALTVACARSIYDQPRDVAESEGDTRR